MKTKNHSALLTNIILGLMLVSRVAGLSQNNAPTPKNPSDFWQRVRIGGGLGLSFGSDFTDITVAPGAVYEFSHFIAAGVGIQGSYVKVKYDYESYIYGGSLIGLFSPIEQLQLSIEPELLSVNTDFYGNGQNDFWSPAVFIGAGYRNQNVTFGLRYNVLYDSDKSVYSEPFIPFVRVYF